MLKTKLFALLGLAMDRSAVKHSVISNNIANVNTPGYKRKTVSFQKELETLLEKREQGEIKQANKKHLPLNFGLDSAPAVIVSEEGNTSLRNDGNNVDIDMELAELAENNIYFNSLAQLLTSQLALLRNSVSEGRR